MTEAPGAMAMTEETEASMAAALVAGIVTPKQLAFTRDYLREKIVWAEERLTTPVSGTMLTHLLEVIDAQASELTRLRAQVREGEEALKELHEFVEEVVLRKIDDTPALRVRLDNAAALLSPPPRTEDKA